MKTIKFLTYPLLFILIATCFVSCFGVPSGLKKEFTEAHNAIPPDFGKEKTVFVVILRGRGSYDKYVKSAVKKYYKGEYVFVNVKKESLNNDKFSDKNKYRYYFDYSDGSTVTTTFSNGQSASSTYKRFYVHDRLLEKRYQSGGETALFGKALKAYMGNLEIKRQSFNQ